MDNEFPGDAGFVCDKLPTTAALSTREKGLRRYLHWDGTLYMPQLLPPYHRFIDDKKSFIDM